MSQPTGPDQSWTIGGLLEWTERFLAQKGVEYPRLDAGVPLQAETKEFSTGSVGWFLNGKTILEVDGTPVSVQISLSMTVVGSKELPQDVAEPVAAAEVA